MKQSLFFLLVLIAFSCQQSPTTTIDTITTVSGKITNPESDSISISKGDFRHKLGMDAEGNFSGEVEGLSEGMYTFSDGRESSSMYIIPGKDVNITLDTEQFDETIAYKGEGAEPSNYLAKKYMNEEESGIDMKALYSSDETTFKSKVEDIAKGKLEFLSSYSTLPASFLSVEKKAINYDKLGLLNNYKDGHAHFTGNPDFEVSADFGDPLKGIDMDNEADFNNIPSYKNIVLSSFTSGDMKDNMDNLSGIKSPSIKKEVIRNLGYYMTPGSPDLEVIYKGLHANSDDEKAKEELTSKYEQYLLLAKGNPSPTFEYIDRDGNMVSMEEMKGKNVYIDVWATWCGPCKAEIPSLKELESEYHGKNVEFVSISIDKMKDKEKWLKMIEEKELKGVQLFSDKDWKSDFVTDYGIQGIPRFILVDAEGKIVSADAPRPSSDSEIKGLFKEIGI